MATLEERLSALATRVGNVVRDGLASKADDSATVHRTGNETINGTKTFGSSPVVPNPSAAAHPVRNDDARNTNARPPTAHTHSAAEIMAAARTVAYGSALTGLVPLSGVMLDVVTCALTGNPTITPAAGTDGQVIRLRCLAGASARTVTFATAVRLGTGITDRAMAIPSGQAGVFGLEWIAGLGTSGVWVLFSEYATAS